MNKKVKEFQRYLKQKGLHYALIFNSRNRDPNFIYLTGFDVESSCLLIPKKGSLELLTFGMEYKRAREESKIKNIKKFSRGKNMRRYLENKLKNKKIGINYSNVSLSSARILRRYCKIRDISKALLELRATKTKEEIKKIKKSCSIASEILKKCISNFKKFKTEFDVKEFLEKESFKNNVKPAFAIVASGPNAAIPHYNARKVRLKKGFCVLDFGVIYKSYFSDITRTIYLGKPSEKEIKLYNHVLGIQEECIKRARPGIKVKKLDNYARKALKGFFHGLGHGVGIEVHEFPNLTEESKDKFEKNMVFTIEPGTYKASKYGIRIEDTALLKDKAEILTKIDKKLKTIN